MIVYKMFKLSLNYIILIKFLRINDNGVAGNHRFSHKNTSKVSAFLLILSTFSLQNGSSLSENLFFDVGSHFLSLHIGCEEVDHLALRIHEEFSEIPGDDFGSLGDGIIEGTVVAQKCENRMGVLSIDLHLLHDGEASLEIVLNESVNLLGGAALLSKELVAGECQNFKALSFQSFMDSHHLLVVL